MPPTPANHLTPACRIGCARIPCHQPYQRQAQTHARKRKPSSEPSFCTPPRPKPPPAAPSRPQPPPAASAARRIALRASRRASRPGTQPCARFHSSGGPAQDRALAHFAMAAVALNRADVEAAKPRLASALKVAHEELGNRQARRHAPCVLQAPPRAGLANKRDKRDQRIPTC